MDIELLDNTRKIQKLLRNNNSFVVVFSDICKCVGDILSANVMVVSKKGKLIGLYNRPNLPLLDKLGTVGIGEFIDKTLNKRLMDVLSTKENANPETIGISTSGENIKAVIMPVDIAGERMGTVFIYRPNEEFSVDDIILSEYVNTVIQLEMMRAIYEEKMDTKRLRTVSRAACESLSSSEKVAIKYVIRELQGDEGVVIASHISAQYGITRSIIVNAIKKLEGAGVLESKSMGMKGTHLKFYNKEYVSMNL